MKKAKSLGRAGQKETVVLLALAAVFLLGAISYQIVNNLGVGETVFAVLPSGSIEATSTPAGAYVFVDGVMRGLSPKTVGGIAEGKHVVRIWANGYNDYSVLVDVSIGKTTAVNAVLTKFGTISAYSSPSDANVFIDSSPRGTTPLIVPAIEEGYHTVKISKKGYVGYSKTVFVRANENTTVSAGLEKAATISVSTVPSGANVYIDGAFAGQSPLTADVAEGNHFVRISLDGYAEYNISFGILAGQTSTVEAKLSRQKGQLYIDSDPKGATVIVDGIVSGKTPLNVFDVETGKHEIRVILQGYREYSTTATVFADETTNLYPGLSKK